MISSFIMFSHVLKLKILELRAYIVQQQRAFLACMGPPLQNKEENGGNYMGGRPRHISNEENWFIK